MASRQRGVHSFGVSAPKWLSRLWSYTYEHAGNNKWTHRVLENRTLEIERKSNGAWVGKELKDSR